MLKLEVDSSSIDFTNIFGHSQTIKSFPKKGK